MGWLDDIGDAVSSAASAVGDAVEDAADAVVDTVEDGVDTVVDGIQSGIESGSEWLCENGGGFLCGVGNVVGGLLDGLLQGVQDILDDAFSIVRDVVGIVGALLSLDFARVLKELANLVTDVILGLGLDALRFVTGGYAIGGIVQYFERDALRKFVEGLLASKFTGDRLAKIRDFVGLGGGKFGFPLSAEHRIFMLDSANTPLWDWHSRGVIDLYSLAGLLSFDSFDVFRPRTVVKSVKSDGSESLVPVTRWTISRYLDSQGRDRRLRVYAMSHALVADRLSLASEKCEQAGVKLSWNDGENFPWFRSYTTHEITTEDEYRFVTVGNPPGTHIGKYLVSSGLRTGALEENCKLVALGAFQLYSNEARTDTDLGYTGGRNIREGPSVGTCETPDRDDSCCNTVDTDEGAGVCYRDVSYEYFFRYVLPHEIGHYVGLCHYGHDGFDHIMWRPGVGLGWVDWSLFSYYLDREPHFTLTDGKNVWRFIVDQLDVCLPAEEIPVPVIE